MEIKTYKVKQYNSTTKTVITVDGIPICICGNGKTLSNIMSYLQGYSNDIKDGKIRKILDTIKEQNESNN